MAPISLQSVQYIVNHVVLPPQLPSSAEAPELILQAEQDLFELVKQAIQELLQHSPVHEKPSWTVLEKTFRYWTTIHNQDGLPAELLLKWLSKSGKDDVIPLVVTAQNASVIIRVREDGAIFESFELSPRPEPVINCKTSLRRSFPAGAVFVPKSTFDNNDFRTQLVQTLRKLDVETVEEMVPTAKKAGRITAEIRDTVHPGLVTDMLMAILASLGRPVSVRQVHKRTRDDAIWDDSLLPWRRSSLWLAIRVTLQTSLLQMASPSKALASYKNLMIVLLTKLSAASLSARLPSDQCFIIQAKIARRSLKLGEAMLNFIHEDALAVGQLLRDRLEADWKSVQQHETTTPVQIDISTLDEDTAMSLSSCGPYLDMVLQSDKSVAANSSDFSPQCPKLVQYQQDGLPSFPDGLAGNDIMFTLAEVELWVADELPVWTATTIGNPADDHCCRLALLALDYKGRATTQYSDSPELLSMMLLTIAEFWLALDKITSAIIPLLLKFPPELSDDLFHPLILSKRDYMVRLKVVEDYITTRQAESIDNYARIITGPLNSGALYFTSLYYDTSNKHKSLRQKIEADAKEKEAAKKVEWEHKYKEYNSLKAEAAASQCTTVDNYWGDEVHSGSCHKCMIEKKVQDMTIDIYEWPLPKNEAQCRAALFELDCPPGFAAWRDLTWTIMQDLGRTRLIKGDQPADTVLNYSGLKDYGSHEASRIVLASETKSVMKSHYRTVHFPVGLSQLYSKNGLQYSYFDAKLIVWISKQTDPPNFTLHCNSIVPKGAYWNIQYAVNFTLHHQAKVIADQDSCSRDLTLHELVAFGSLRADGEQTQWLNIQRELEASNLTLNTEAVCILITQTANQAGSTGRTSLRLTHGIFESASFCAGLVNTANSLLVSIGTNWKSDHTMMIVIVVALRITNLTSDEDCRLCALTILHKCRQIILDWIGSLSKLLESTADSDQIQRIQQFLLKIGLLGKMTYNLDNAHIEKGLNRAEDVKHWVHFSIAVHDNTPGSKANLPAVVRRLLLNDKKLSLEITATVRVLLSKGDNDGLDQAVNIAWSSFQITSAPWASLPLHSERWLQKSTSVEDGQCAQIVSYNLLEGELLVNGRPLGRLPQEYTHNDLYVRIFGSQIFSVCASNMPGMLYMSARDVEGHELHFGKRAGDIVIRIRTEARTWEAIPHRKLQDDFPSILIEEFMHWLEISARILEFRPFGELYKQRIEWQLHYPIGSQSVLWKGSQKLLDVRSKTVGSINSVFAPLEDSSYIHVTKSSDCKIDIELPRLGLRFWLNHEDELECRELRKIVDPDQYVGTFIGLRSKMVLCERGVFAQQSDRTIIIPAGNVSVSKHGPHVAVSISTEDRHVEFFRFQVDSILGRLRSDGSLRSQLFQAYIHALTSNVLPDPLIHRTGTEEGLLLLKALSKQAWKPLDEEQYSMLHLLNVLTPCRKYYPEHLQVMQKVKWSSRLSFLSQHDGFGPLCRQLVEAGTRFGIFYTNDQPISSLDQSGSLHLSQRAELRHSTFRSPQFGGTTDLSASDDIYSSRDQSSMTDRGLKAYQIAVLVTKWPSRFVVSRNIIADFKKWGAVSGFGTVFDTSGSITDLLQLSFAHAWAPLRGLCCGSSQQKNRFELLFLFGIIAYGNKISSLEDLGTLLAYAFRWELPHIRPFPQHERYDLSIGSFPQLSVLANTFKGHAYKFELSRTHLPAAERRSEKREYDSQVEAQATAIAKSYVEQWPCAEPVKFADAAAPLLKVWEIHNYVLARFPVLMENREMEAYLVNVQAILDHARDSSVAVSPGQWQARIDSTRSYIPCIVPDIASLLSIQAPKTVSLLDQLYITETTRRPVENKNLRRLLSSIDSKSNTSCYKSIRQKYKMDLEASLDAFHKNEEPVQPADIPYDFATITSYFDSSKQQLKELYERISIATQPKTPLSTLLSMSGFWPRSTVVDLLGLLASTHHIPIDEQWTDCLIRLGRAVTLCQRARRLVLAAEAGQVSKFFSEIHHSGSTEWDPKELPEWLLFEIENDLLIRPIQARVAREMLAPSCSSNMLTQLNMGEGKSSVIVPIVASATANGKQLSRVLVLKSLTTQMLDTLVHCLGGLVGRQIFFMPFSRKSKVDKAMLSHMQSLYEDCVKNRGILLMQPEFLLSFKLMGIERLAAGDLSLGKQLLKIQEWLDANAKDLLDESDEILDVKFQLIYTIGNQRHLDGQPERWLLTQSVFDLVDKHATAIASESHDDIETTRRSDDSFPTIRLLGSHAGSKLNSRLVEDIIESKLPGLNLDSWSLADKGVLSFFLLNLEAGEVVCSTITDLCRNDESLLKRILLLRGLFAHKVLQFILGGKRWSVNFGQHPNRCLVAVPYRAKGVPAATAEFGHPDVTIALTCLTYYYSGMSDHQMRLCFELLQKADDPSLEYQSWTSRSSVLPPNLRNWNAVNLEDYQQCYSVLFPALRYSKRVADFYMANVVFPREGKEFDQKLSSSGWDIPSTLGGQRLTTGFSGTNDNRFLLPSTIMQHDLPELQHTSGKVLSYVLRTENLRYECAKDANGRQLSTEGLLQLINRLDHKAKILIDVGAQVLELANEDVVKDWVKLVDDVDAGIFFNAEDKVMVLARDNWKPEPFATSSFSGRIDRCLVYLDEVHTRGTDLKLPKDARAVVTLGPRLTKDRLVQACMRLRQLGHGQSLFFVAPPEVHRDLLKITGKSEGDCLDGYDVINWALAQSCLNIERSEPLRIMQGLSYHHRQRIAQQYFADEPEEGEIVENNAAAMFIEKEEQSLYDLYAPSSMKSTDEKSLLNISSQDSNPEVQTLLHRWKQIDPDAVDGAKVLEEHEREVAHEVEKETEIQRPPPAKPLRESVDANLKTYVQNGASDTFRLFQTADKAIVRKSSAGKLAGKFVIWRDIRVSDGFRFVVEKPASGFNDDYLRPVNWILTSKRASRVTELLIISQYEANELMSDIKHPSSEVLLHVYEPRVTRAMSSVDSSAVLPLSLATQNWLSLRRKLRQQLHLFAGQLYLNTYEEYLALRTESPRTIVSLTFLKEWIGIRRRGQNFSQTHIGRIVSGWNLQPEDFQ